MTDWEKLIIGAILSLIVGIFVGISLHFIIKKIKQITNRARPVLDISRNGAVYNPDGIELVYVEGSGSGIMAIKGFYIGKYEITQMQWRAIMGSNPSKFQDDKLPVEMVSWNDTQDFLNKLNAATDRNYRLPTETEWSYSANGGNKFNDYEYSGSNCIDDVAWYANNSGKYTHAVGTKEPNELGIYDMSGNIWEWCHDLYDSSNSNRALRGGGWYLNAFGCRIANRGSNSPGARYDSIGFRVVLPAASSPELNVKHNK
jgi:hypothetical protein